MMRMMVSRKGISYFIWLLFLLGLLLVLIIINKDFFAALLDPATYRGIMR